jgi:hypothetical protein
MRDDVSALIGDPAYCAKQPSGVYVCRALHKGRIVDIAQAPAF